MKPEIKNSGDDIARTLGVEQHAGRGRKRKRWIAIVLLVMALVITPLVFNRVSRSDPLQYSAKEARRGDLTVSVTATGNLEPTNQVDVSSELSGIIKTVEVDYNDRVKVGQPLAKLDTLKLKAEVMKSKAALESANAGVMEARATVKEARKKLARLVALRKLTDDKLPSQHDLDLAEATVDRALADEASAKARVSECRAELDADSTDFSKAVIRSPINGIVLVRSVEPGQTVASSLQAPVLFTLAEDLTQMELHVDVDEADVGQIKEGQVASFTVDAYSERTFPARITQVRYGAETVDGVVTYETVLNVNNADQYLRPGMTATAEITVNKVENAVLVPNAVLRFSPTSNEKKSLSGKQGLVSKLLPGPPRRPSKKHREDASSGKGNQHVWTLCDGRLTSIPVKIGATDGVVTEVTSGNLEAGTMLVTGVLNSGG